MHNRSNRSSLTWQQSWEAQLIKGCKVPNIPELEKPHEMQTQNNSPRDAETRIMLHFSPPEGSLLGYLKMANGKNIQQPESNNYCEKSPKHESVSNPACPKLTELMSPRALLAKEQRLRESKGLRPHGGGIVTGRYIKKSNPSHIRSG